MRKDVKMSKVYTKIEEQIVQAQKARDQKTLDSLRYLKSEVLKVSKDSRKEITDELAVSVIKTTIKKLKKAYDLYVEQDQNLRAVDVSVEIALYECFLPQMLDEDETEAAVIASIQALGATEKKDMGRVMGHLKQAYGQSIDMGMASKIVQSRL